MHRRFEIHSRIGVHFMFFTDLMKNWLIEKQIANLINLCHPCIAALVGRPGRWS
jgi:hypothetical protein